MTNDDFGLYAEPCDCSICVPLGPMGEAAFLISGAAINALRPVPQTCGHAPDVQCENCRPPEPVREVCSVVGGLHGCDGSPHTSLLPVSGDAAVSKHDRIEACLLNEKPKDSKHGM